MPILQVAFSRGKRIALLQPVDAPAPDGYEVLGNTVDGVTFFAAVQALLMDQGIMNMSNVTIAFDPMKYAEPVKEQVPVSTVQERAAQKTQQDLDAEIKEELDKEKDDSQETVESE